MIYIRNVKMKQIKNGSAYKLLHTCAYDLLKEAVKAEYPERADKLTMRVKEHGKPYFVEIQEDGREVDSDIQFNLSHSNEMVACVISQGQVGIDIEKVRPFRGKVADKVLNEREWEFLQSSKNKDEDFIRFWTLKEAYGKYTGKGLVMDLKEVAFHWQNGVEIECNDGSVRVFQWKIGQEYYLSLCVEKQSEMIKTLTNLRINDRIYTC